MFKRGKFVDRLTCFGGGGGGGDGGGDASSGDTSGDSWAGWASSTGDTSGFAGVGDAFGGLAGPGQTGFDVGSWQAAATDFGAFAPGEAWGGNPSGGFPSSGDLGQAGAGPGFSAAGAPGDTGDTTGSTAAAGAPGETGDTTGAAPGGPSGVGQGPAGFSPGGPGSFDVGTGDLPGPGLDTPSAPAGLPGPTASDMINQDFEELSIQSPFDQYDLTVPAPTVDPAPFQVDTQLTTDPVTQAAIGKDQSQLAPGLPGDPGVFDAPTPGFLSAAPSNAFTQSSAPGQNAEGIFGLGTFGLTPGAPSASTIDSDFAALAQQGQFAQAAPAGPGITSAADLSGTLSSPTSDAFDQALGNTINATPGFQASMDIGLPPGAPGEFASNIAAAALPAAGPSTPAAAPSAAPSFDEMFSAIAPMDQYQATLDVPPGLQQNAFVGPTAPTANDLVAPGVIAGPTQEQAGFVPGAVATSAALSPAAPAPTAASPQVGFDVPAPGTTGPAPGINPAGLPGPFGPSPSSDRTGDLAGIPGTPGAPDQAPAAPGPDAAAPGEGRTSATSSTPSSPSSASAGALTALSGAAPSTVGGTTGGGETPGGPIEVPASATPIASTTPTTPTTPSPSAVPPDIQIALDSFGFDLAGWIKSHPDLAKSLGWA